MTTPSTFSPIRSITRAGMVWREVWAASGVEERASSSWMLLVWAPTVVPAPKLEPKVKTITEGKLTLGTSADYAPYEFHIQENGVDKIVGFDIALAQAIADELAISSWMELVWAPTLVPAPKSSMDLYFSRSAFRTSRDWLWSS